MACYKGNPNAKWNEYLVQMTCGLQVVAQLMSRGKKIVKCYKKLKLAYQDKWNWLQHKLDKITSTI